MIPSAWVKSSFEIDTRLVAVPVEDARRHRPHKVVIALQVFARSVRCRALPLGPRSVVLGQWISQPRIGLIPALAPALLNSTAPAIDPWSVSPIAGISNSAARLTSGPIRHAPSRMEYSLWTWRWAYCG